MILVRLAVAIVMTATAIMQLYTLANDVEIECLTTVLGHFQAQPLLMNAAGTIFSLLAAALYWALTFMALTKEKT